MRSAQSRGTRTCRGTRSGRMLSISVGSESQTMPSPFSIEYAADHLDLVPMVPAEDVADSPAQRPRTVDHEQDRLLGIEATVDEVREQLAAERGVFGRALPQPERDLDAVG